MSNQLRKFKRKEFKKSFKEAKKRVDLSNQQKRKYDEAFRQFRERWKNSVREYVNPFWPKVSKFVPPEWYFNLVKGWCEKIYGEESIAELIMYSNKHKWPKWRLYLNDLPRRFVAWILFYLFLNWLMVIHRRLIYFGISNKISHDKKKGTLKQVIKYYGKVVDESAVKYGS